MPGPRGARARASLLLLGITVACWLTLQASPARAQDCFDESIRGELDPRGERLGISKRDFIKTGRFELTLLGGYQGSDLYSATYVYGGALAYHLFEGLALEGSFQVSRADANLLDLSRVTTGRTTYVGHRAMQASGAALFTPVHAKLKVGRAIAHFDLYLALGAGVTFAEATRGTTFSAGAGAKVFLNRWLALRVDVRDHISQQELVGDNQLVNNVAVTFGLSAFVPFKG